MEKPKKGDMVHVRNGDHGKWRKVIYLETIEGADSPYVCLDMKDVHRYTQGYRYDIEARKIMQVGPVVVTKKDIYHFIGPDNFIIEGEDVEYVFDSRSVTVAIVISIAVIAIVLIFLFLNTQYC